MKKINTLTWMWLLTFAFLGLAISPPSQAGQFVDLTGNYSCDDGGTYYIKTHGDEIFWYGKGKGWANVFYGKFEAPNKYVGRWADVPSDILRNFGSLTIRRGPNPRYLFLESKTGPFSGKKWSKIDTKMRVHKKKIEVK